MTLLHVLSVFCTTLLLMTLLHVLSVFCTTLLLMTLLHVLSVVWDWTVTRVTSDSHSYCPCWLKSIPIL